MAAGEGIAGAAGRSGGEKGRGRRRKERRVKQGSGGWMLRMRSGESLGPRLASPQRVAAHFIPRTELRATHRPSSPVPSPLSRHHETPYTNPRFHVAMYLQSEAGSPGAFETPSRRECQPSSLHSFPSAVRNPSVSLFHPLARVLAPPCLLGPLRKDDSIEGEETGPLRG